MSEHALRDSHDRDSAVEGAARHLRVWLAATGLSYDATARDLFVRAHPVLFGRECDLAIRGYDRWRWRHRLHDTSDAFARYIAPRHQRWIATHAELSVMAPCLISSGQSQPCWQLKDFEASSARDQGELSVAA